MFIKIISGGQTGVDRAALDVALELGLPCGGWCPKGRRAEDGPIPAGYPLKETPWWGYPQRTEWNIRDSDGTLVLLQGEPDRGTRLTIDLAARMGKPCLAVNVTEKPEIEAFHTWAVSQQIRILNVAGPREGESPGIQAQATRQLRQLRQLLAGAPAVLPPNLPLT